MGLTKSKFTVNYSLKKNIYRLTGSYGLTRQVFEKTSYGDHSGKGMRKVKAFVEVSYLHSPGET